MSRSSSTGARSVILALSAAVLASTSGPASAAPSGVQIRQADDDKITVGETTLAVEPDAAFAALGDLSRWPTIFPDIERAVITKQQGADVYATMIGHNDHHDNLHFHNTPAARMIWFEDTGGRATVWLELVLVPGAEHGTTVVKSRLFADVHGVASLVVSGSKVRQMREEKLTHDLVAVRQYFAPETASR